MGSTPGSPESITALDYIQNQLDLEQQAREVMPYDPNHCSHHDEPVRQQVFACLTCRKKNDDQANGICYSCSIQCHSDHDVVELLTRRNFTCDCGTTRMKSFGGCNLRKNFDMLDKPAETNVYNHNFASKFCHCDSPYKELETSIMFQCLLGDVCKEDWFHEECILNVPKPERKPKTTAKTYPQGVNVYDTLPDITEEGHPHEQDKGDNSNEHEDDDEDEETMEGLPNHEEFDAFICWKCVDRHKEAFEKVLEIKEAALDKVIRKNGKSTASEEEPPAKKVKAEETYSVFLKPDYQSALSQSKDKTIKQFVLKFPFLITEEPIWEPPRDEDNASSLLDAGAQALKSLPRDKALDGMQAYSKIKESLTNFLRPFAEQGKVVTEDDVNQFFATMEQSKKS
ncbi:hypothetical protein TRICI_000666 [Trichomonascus ciferrii]|uniref:UBR-type domain-containing protein n=1 Tax=Trichomonascus ciferrii TaxID=44093 RepID=A0A642VC24_9ASCO|nr:hypothetical protein TRICI_000666 [Trichomonascus ciferrii]